MAGSYRHCVDEGGRFRGVYLLDDLGDAYEALEEMYGMIWRLASNLSEETTGASPADLVEDARVNYRDGLAVSPGVAPDPVDPDDEDDDG